LSDDAGNTFVVLVGVGEWHGLPSELVERRHEGTLVIAKRFGERVRVFMGPLGTLVRNADQLQAHGSGDYSFHLEWRHDRALIKEIPGADLTLLCEFAYARNDKDSNQRIASQGTFQGN
jgi:hypothetical protein